MIYGIVGHEQAKFTPTTESAARDLIRRFIGGGRVDAEVASGECPLGGVDAYARQEAERLGLPFLPFPPAFNAWEAFKARNIQIGDVSDYVVSIVVETLPPTYRGRTFGLCYHCGVATHVKSGGCWTVKYARSIGKPGDVYVIRPDGSVFREPQP
jgi:hypothetical protein